MGKILSILILLASISCWGKSASVIDNTSDLTARSWLVADENNRILDGRNTEDVRSIASITKVFTVLTVISAQQDLFEYIPYTNGLKLTRQELIELAMVRSDNLSAELLCKHYTGGYMKCIEDMNSNARGWGLQNTTLVDATGLLPGNTSTPRDLLRLLAVAEKSSEIVQASKKTKVEIMSKRKWLIFKQTNPLVGRKHEFIVSKTGTTNAAGGCIVLSINTDKGIRRVVVLGSQNGRTRIPEAEFIFTNIN